MRTDAIEILEQAAEQWRQAGRGVALATVVETWGSAPRPVGSNLVIDDQGNFLGSVSGGCVEGAVVTEALDVIESGKPKTLEGVADETRLEGRAVLRRHHPVLVEKVESIECCGHALGSPPACGESARGREWQPLFDSFLQPRAGGSTRTLGNGSRS
jgi:hypothetical protein